MRTKGLVGASCVPSLTKSISSASRNQTRGLPTDSNTDSASATLAPAWSPRKNGHPNSTTVMTNKQFLAMIQGFTARRAVGASTARGSRKGTVKTCRDFLRTVDLSQFATSDPPSFNATLDRVTNRFAKKLKPRHHKWGLARKVLNIFLRDSFYTDWLRNGYRLGKARNLFELPLDEITATLLHEKHQGKPLRPWRGVSKVDAALNREYQAAALKVAKQKRVARVHLDALWWSQSRD
jgi:hypothetical protein